MLPLLVGFLLAAVIALAIAVYLLSQPPATEIDSASSQQKAAPQASDGEEAEQPAVSQTVQGGQQQAQQQQEQPDNAQLEQLIDALNANVGQGVVILGVEPQQGRVVIRPDVAVRNNMELHALQEALNYYAAAGRGDYAATYRMLANVDKRHYSQAEWIQANRNLDSAAARYVIHSVETADRNRVHINLTVYLADGSSFERQTSFIWEGGEWRHDLTAEERTMFDNAL